MHLLKTQRCPLAGRQTFLERNLYMRSYVKEFEERLITLFERKAQEFTKFAEERPQTSMVANQLADLYRDLAELMRK